MGIYVSLQAVSPEILEKMVQRPELCMEALAPAELETFELGLEERPEDWCSLDKAWHAVSYLFTGTDWGAGPPLGYIVEGGVELEWDDSDFEVPPRALSPDQVKGWNEAVQGIDDATLRARFDPDRMTELQISPGFWNRDPDRAALLDWVMKQVGPFRLFLQETVRRGYALLVVTS